MKFTYIDESGDSSQGDVFTMVGFLIDATKLRKCTEAFDAKFQKLRDHHSLTKKEFKTKNFINGTNPWNRVPPEERKKFIHEMCNLVISSGSVYVFALSFDKFRIATKNYESLSRHQKSYWVTASMFIACHIQKDNQKIKNNKGHSVLIIDNNSMYMPLLSDSIHKASVWYDGLYREPDSKNKRLSCIINTAFSINSKHSSLIQVADILSYLYRRHIELFTRNEKYKGERDFYYNLTNKIEKKRKRIGRFPNQNTDAVKFYQSIVPNGWRI